jgi:ankyrin repeat protein
MMSRTLILVLTAGAALFAAEPHDLFTAIRNGNHAQVQQLLRAGANVNAVDGDGTTALMHAVIESDVSMMKLLVERCQRQRKERARFRPRCCAASNQAKAGLLVDAGADVKVTNKRGATPMRVAALTFDRLRAEASDSEGRRARLSS